MNPDDGKTKFLKSLDAYLMATENKEPPLIPPEIPYTYQLLARVGLLNQEDQPGAANIEQEKKHKASESITVAPETKIQVQIPEGKVPVCNTETSDRAPVKRAKHPTSKPQKPASGGVNKTKSHSEKAKRSHENNPKKAAGSKQPGNQVLGLKPGFPRSKRKKNQPELGQETFKKPRSSLGAHMLEAVQVFHALGKRRDNKAGLLSSQALGNSSNTKHPQPGPAIKPWLHIPPEGTGPEKTQVRAQKPEGQAENHPPPSQDELPPPGKVKLVPLSFLTLDKPQVRPVPRRPPSLAARRPSRPGSNSAQPITDNGSQTATVNGSGVRPAGATRPIFPNSVQPALTNPARPRVLHSAPLRPAVHTAASGAAFQREPAVTGGNKLQPPAKPPAQFLLRDFSLQPIPWRKPNVPEPVMSTPIT
ncbi:PREDICTED: uncharacterized protein C2orf78-like [Elephantulus edwardii]|uniref:uncharacterized protein C2orf78-like n=1 Tax=Elephantulus edwardii TaxID=28737 RepID=UPI0003F095AF|nr:PREDICTED: uncharacterized protein C2orf78-like [Elephantulus edwardii]